ncbi:MAG: DNA primase [Verrucomicrobiota bacterium]
MPRISQRSIETIKHQVNLVDVVSTYVQLKRSGRSFKGLSPFTQEKTPSFYVHPDKGYYKCFSTGEGGDIFNFVQKMENLEFVESIEFIAKKFNITLEYEAGGPSREEVSLRKQLFDLHELAASWFHQQLSQSEEAAPVRTYWKEQRAFESKIASEYLIGYAPASTNALAKFCETKGISTAAMQRSGLFFAREGERNYGNFRSFFRGRLMIPIRDVQGRVVAFTARQLEQTPTDDRSHQAKYINSPETPIFHKGRVLFGMDHARKHLKEGGNFLMVEGQLDAIRCWSVGLDTAIAPQGTGITEDQLLLLRRYEPSMVECLLDGDSAGRKAALKTIPLAFKTGLEFQFLLLPEKVDPDDLLREGGADALEPLRQNARSAIELLVEDSLPEGRTPTTRDKTLILQKVYELITEVSSQVAREDYIIAAARLIGVDADAAIRDFSSQQKNRPSPNTAQSPPSPVKTGQDALLTRANWELLWLALHHPEFAKPIAETIDYEWIDRSSTAGRLLSRLVAEINEGLIEDISQIETLSEKTQDKELLADLHLKDLEVEEPQKHIETCLQHLYKNHLNQTRIELEQRLSNLSPSSDQHLEIMREISAIRKALAHPPKL